MQNNPRKITIGKDTHIRGELVTFPHGGSITIGNECFVGSHSKIWSSNSIIIGDRVLIAHNVNIHDTNGHPIDHVMRNLHYMNVY